MKFLSKNLALIFGVTVVLPFILILSVPLGGCGDNGFFNFLGGACSGFIAIIPATIAVFGSILTILLNLITKKNLVLFYVLGSIFPLIVIIFYIYASWSLGKANFIL